jgi:hypothetical protein
MEVSNLTMNILKICLIMADYNVKIPIEEIILRFENFQEENDRTFSISKRDFRTLVSNLIYFELQLKKTGEDLNDIKLIDLIIAVLNHYSYYKDCF